VTFAEKNIIEMTSRSIKPITVTYCITTVAWLPCVRFIASLVYISAKQSSSIQSAIAFGN